MLNRKFLVITDIKRIYGKSVQVQHIYVRVLLYSRGKRVLKGNLYTTIVYYPNEMENGKFPERLQKAKIENGILSLEDALENKLHKRTSLYGHRGYFIFDRYEVVEF